MAAKVKIKLNRLQWECLSELMRSTTRACPIEGWSLESYIIADLYVKKMAFWSIFPYQKDNKVKVTFSMIQAIAINDLFSQCSDRYNMLVRIYIEPHLIININKTISDEQGSFSAGHSSAEPVHQEG